MLLYVAFLLDDIIIRTVAILSYNKLDIAVTAGVSGNFVYNVFTTKGLCIVLTFCYFICCRRFGGALRPINMWCLSDAVIGDCV